MTVGMVLFIGFAFYIMYLGSHDGCPINKETIQQATACGYKSGQHPPANDLLQSNVVAYLWAAVLIGYFLWRIIRHRRRKVT